MMKISDIIPDGKINLHSIFCFYDITGSVNSDIHARSAYLVTTEDFKAENED